MHCCPRAHCRYWAKTHAELAKHTRLAHPNAPAVDTEGGAGMELVEAPMVSVAGLAPQLRRRKRRFPSAPAVKAEGEPGAEERPVRARVLAGIELEDVVFDEALDLSVACCFHLSPVLENVLFAKKVLLRHREALVG